MVKKLLVTSFLLTVSLPILSQDDSMWKLGKKKISFFKSPKKHETAPKIDKRKEIEDLFAESSVDDEGKTSKKLPPKHLVDLLVEPGKKTATRFVNAEKQKVELLLKAIEEVSKIYEDKK